MCHTRVGAIATTQVLKMVSRERKHQDNTKSEAVEMNERNLPRTSTYSIYVTQSTRHAQTVHDTSAHGAHTQTHTYAHTGRRVTTTGVPARACTFTIQSRYHTHQRDVRAIYAITVVVVTTTEQ